MDGCEETWYARGLCESLSSRYCRVSIVPSHPIDKKTVKNFSPYLADRLVNFDELKKVDHLISFSFLDSNYKRSKTNKITSYIGSFDSDSYRKDSFEYDNIFFPSEQMKRYCYCKKSKCFLFPFNFEHQKLTRKKPSDSDSIFVSVMGYGIDVDRTSQYISFLNDCYLKDNTLKFAWLSYETVSDYKCYEYLRKSDIAIQFMTESSLNVYPRMMYSVAIPCLSVTPITIRSRLPEEAYGELRYFGELNVEEFVEAIHTCIGNYHNETFQSKNDKEKYIQLKLQSERILHYMAMRSVKRKSDNVNRYLLN